MFGRFISSLFLINFTLASSGLYNLYNSKYNKSLYNDENIIAFENNMLTILKHNSNKSKLFTMDLNKFTDTTSRRRNYRFHRIKNLWQTLPQKLTNNKDFFIFSHPPAAISSAGIIGFDWRNYNVTSKVVDQGDCGSCWAFSAIGSYESHMAIHNGGRLYQFSAQQLVDCSKDNFGCDGGMIDSALKYIVETKNIVFDSSYPYTNKEGKCRNDIITNEHNYPIFDLNPSSWAFISGENSDYLANILRMFGPVSVAIEVKDNLFFYSKGIYDDITCTREGVNHAVLLVGYGHDEIVHKDYWIIKNSWGSDWGERGYLRILKNDLNLCGILSFPFIPLFK